MKERSTASLDSLALKERPCLDSEEINENKEHVDFDLNIDELLKAEVGSCGLWQWMIALLCILPAPSMATFPVFVNAAPKVRCKMETNVEGVFRDSNLTFDQIKAIIGPSHGCSRYARNWSDVNLLQTILIENITDGGQNLESCPFGYVYQSEQYQYQSTVVKEFDLVCDYDWIAPMGTSLFMLGMMVGYIFGGYCGDTFGRKYTAIFFSVLEILAGIGISCSPNHHIYHFTRTIVGFTNTGKMSVLRIVPIEFTSAKYRGYFTSFTMIGVLFGHRAMLALWAYLIPSWRWLNAAAMSPSCLGLLFICLLPESPRWLNSKNRHIEAIQVLQKGRKINYFLRRNDEPSRKLQDLMDNMQSLEVERQVIKRTLLRVQKFPLHCLPFVGSSVKCLILSIWLYMAQALVLFGVLLYARIIKESIYLVAFLNSLNAVPGPIVASFLYRLCRFRRTPLIVSFGIASACLLVGGIYTVAFRPKSDLVLNVCCNGCLIMLSATMVMLSVYVPELFPSEQRTSAVGIAAGLGRIGSSVSTFVNQLDDRVAHGTPIVIYSVAVFLQAISLLFLPDTTGEYLQDRVQRVICDEDDQADLKTAVELTTIRA